MSITAAGNTQIQLQARPNMPMKSQMQRKALWAKNPKVAQEFEDATPKGAKLPMRAGKRMMKKK